MTLREALSRVLGEAGSTPVETELRPSEVVERVRRRRRVALAWRTASAAGAAAVIVASVLVAPGLVPWADRGGAPVATGGPALTPMSARESTPTSSPSSPRETPTEPANTPTVVRGPEGDKPGDGSTRTGDDATPTPEERTATSSPGNSSTAEKPRTAMWSAASKSGAGTAKASEPARLADIRVGRHQDFDRVVFDFASATQPKYTVRYVKDGELRAPGSGRPVAIAGQYDLEVTFEKTSNAGLNDDGTTPGYPAVREVKYLGGYEQVHMSAIGVNGEGAGGRPGFRVYRYDNPTRVVIDVAH